MGYTNDKGVYVYDETDVSTNASQMLNKQSTSLTAMLGTADWAPISVTWLPGFSGTVYGLKRAGQTFIRARVTGTLAVGATAVCTLPENWRFSFPAGSINPRGGAHVTGGYIALCYASSSGEMGVVQQTGASRASADLDITGPTL